MEMGGEILKNLLSGAPLLHHAKEQTLETFKGFERCQSKISQDTSYIIKLRKNSIASIFQSLSRQAFFFSNETTCLKIRGVKEGESGGLSPLKIIKEFFLGGG